MYCDLLQEWRNHVVGFVWVWRGSLLSAARSGRPYMRCIVPHKTFAITKSNPNTITRTQISSLSSASAQNSRTEDDQQTLFESRRGLTLHAASWSPHLVFGRQNSFLPGSNQSQREADLSLQLKPSHISTPFSRRSLNSYISICQPSVRKFCDFYYSGVQTAPPDFSCKLCAHRK
jgi:hypothetical protein